MSQIQPQTPVPKKAKTRKRNTNARQAKRRLDFNDVLHDLERELPAISNPNDKIAGVAVDTVDFTRDQNRTTSTSYQPGPVITGVEDVWVPALPVDTLHHFLRFTQYLGRYDRRKERVAGLRLKLEYEIAQLTDRERWRAESLEAVAHEVHEASQRRAEATVIEPATTTTKVPPVLFDKVKDAMDRTREDDQAVVAQARKVSRMEEALKSAEGRLHRVMDSMIVAAKKSIDQSGITTTDSETLISNSTQAGTEPTTVENKLSAPPPIVEEYFDKLGMKNIMFERAANIEWERREELIRREIARDQSSDPGADQSELYKLADEDYVRDLRHANIELEAAIASFESVQQQCEHEEINPLTWAMNDRDDEMDDDEDDETLVAPRRQASNTLPMTMSTIAPSLTPGRNTIAIGPDPDDPQGLIATEVYFDPKHHAADVQSSKSVEAWMKDLPEHENKRVFSNSDSPTLGELEQAISDHSLAAQPAALGILGQAAATSKIDLSQSNNINGDVHMPALETLNDTAGDQCMDDQMLHDQSRIDSKFDAESAIDQRGSTDFTHSFTMEQLVSNTQDDASGNMPALQQPAEVPQNASTDARTSQLITLAIEDMQNSMHIPPDSNSRPNSGKKPTSIEPSRYLDRQPIVREQRPSSRKEAIVHDRASEVALSEDNSSDTAQWVRSVIRDNATIERSTLPPVSTASVIDAEHERNAQPTGGGTHSPFESSAPEPWSTMNNK